MIHEGARVSVLSHLLDTGGIPKELGQLFNLEKLALQNNQLKGGLLEMSLSPDGLVMVGS